MADWVKQLLKAFSEKGGIFMFLRAQLSAQMATITDFVITIILAKFFAMYYVYATCIGSACGGIFNCIINYEWTFKCHECKKIHVIIKYTSVWAGSVFLNTYGTYYLTEWILGIDWIRDVLIRYIDDFFIIPKLIVSMLVALFWNYYLQRIFVYRNVDVKGLFKSRN